MGAQSAARTFDVARVRADFPILAQPSHGKPLTYLDSAASSQKPEVVIAALDRYYREGNANIHRGVYELSERATATYDEARAAVARFIGAPDARGVIFVRNTTEAINLVARSWGAANLAPGDTVALTLLEHHSNIVPWQLVAKERGARVRFVDIDADGRLRLDQLDTMLRTERVKFVGVTHVANAIGTINPIPEIAARVHAVGALLLVDSAQGVPHMPVDVQALGADFLAFSGHKLLGPMGIGVLWGRRELLEAMPPYMGGGDMIRSVTTEGSTWADLPAKFEAGTPSVGDAAGLNAALGYLSDLGMDAVRAHERELVGYALERLRRVPELTLYGPEGEDRAGVVSFNLADVHPHDVATILDGEGIAVRAGHHCAQPLMTRLDVPATTRASFYVYNDEDDVDRLVDGLATVRRIFETGA